MTSLLERAPEARPGLWDAPYSPDMIAQEASIGGPVLSPDGRKVAYVRDYNQRADLWIMSSSGEQPRLITADAPAMTANPNAPFTGGFGGGFTWTRDSAALVYTSSRDGKIYRVPAAGGRAERLTEGRGSHVSPKLAPDGSFLAYVVNRGDIDGQTFVALRDLGTATPATRRLTPDGVIALDPAISPDGEHVACVLFPLDNRWAHDSQIAIIELRTGRITVVTPTDDVINVAPRWSPDGASLAFVSDRSGYLNVYTIPTGGGSPVALVSESFEQSHPTWSPDGRRIAYLRNERAEVQIMTVDIASGASTRVSTRPGVHSSMSWTSDASGICAIHQSPLHAPEIVLYRLDGSEPRQLTHSALGGLHDPDHFVMPEHVTWTSADGVEVHGLLLKPKRVVPNGHPVLVHVHGGPTTQFNLSWDPMAQYFVARGWAMIKPNYRGSMGYGRAYADLLHGSWGEGDRHDNVTSVNVLRERGLVDERRVAIWGSSAGGYATLCAMTMAPGAFVAGVELAGVSDMVGMRYDSDIYGRHLPDSEIGPMADSYDLWVERSPVTHAARVEGPLLILQGSADRRVPPSQSEAMVRALERAGKVVEYHVYDGEPHGLRKCASVRDYITRMEDFLARHVLLD